VFIPIAFEVMILVAALVAFLGLLFLNGLPHPHHPVFNVPQFARASQDRFFLCIEATDPLFRLKETTEFLIGLAPHGPVHIVTENEPGEMVGLILEPPPAPQPVTASPNT
jgi:hypothetical protein